MRFKTLKIGKPGEEPVEDDADLNETTASQIAEMGEEITSKTKDLEETAMELDLLSDVVSGAEENDDAPHPHGPLSELSLDANDEIADSGAILEIDDVQLDDDGEDIKLVELNTDAAPAAPAEPAAVQQAESDSQGEPDDSDDDDGDDDSLNNLFGDIEEEENPLASLISSLPDVSVQELLDDIQEINEIIRDWQRS